MIFSVLPWDILESPPLLTIGVEKTNFENPAPTPPPHLMDLLYLKYL